MKNLFFLFICVIVTGCASATRYQKADRLGFGYHSTLLDNKSGRVSFKGNPLTERADVEMMLFYRAAELTLEAGYSHFKFFRAKTDRQELQRLQPVVVPSVIQDVQGRWVYRNTGLPYNNGWLTPWGIRATNAPGSNQFEAVGFFAMSKTPKQNDVYFDANAVIKNLKTKILFKNE